RPAPATHRPFAGLWSGRPGVAPPGLRLSWVSARGDLYATIRSRARIPGQAAPDSAVTPGSGPEYVDGFVREPQGSTTEPWRSHTIRVCRVRRSVLATAPSTSGRPPAASA